MISSMCSLYVVSSRLILSQTHPLRSDSRFFLTFCKCNQYPRVLVIVSDPSSQALLYCSDVSVTTPSSIDNTGTTTALLWYLVTHGERQRWQTDEGRDTAGRDPLFVRPILLLKDSERQAPIDADGEQSQ